MAFERADDYDPGVEMTVEDRGIHIESEELRDAIKSVHYFEDAIPIDDVPTLIDKISHKLHELAETSHADYYNELHDLRCALLGLEVKVRFGANEELVAKLAEESPLEVHNFRSALDERLSEVDNVTESDIREATQKIDEAALKYEELYDL